MEVVEKAGLSFTVPRDPNEPNTCYYRRRMFIANLQPKTEKAFREYETYSRVFANMISLKCRYPASLEKKVKELAEKGSKRTVPKSKVKRKVKNTNKPTLEVKEV